MTTKKKATVVSISDEQKCRRDFKIPATHQLSEHQLIEWLIKIVAESKGKYDCSWIGAELVRRFTLARRQLARQQKSYDELWNTHFKDLERLGGELEETRRVHAQKSEEAANCIAELEKTIESAQQSIRDHLTDITRLEKQVDELSEANAKLEAQLAAQQGEERAAVGEA